MFWQCALFLIAIATSLQTFAFGDSPILESKNMRLFDSHHIQNKEHTLYVETIGNSENPACILIPGAMEGAWCWSEHFCQRIGHPSIPGWPTPRGWPARYAWMSLKFPFSLLKCDSISRKIHLFSSQGITLSCRIAPANNQGNEIFLNLWPHSS